MKYLLDQGLSRSTVKYLQEMGIESDHVGNLGMAAASDECDRPVRKPPNLFRRIQLQ